VRLNFEDQQPLNLAEILKQDTDFTQFVQQLQPDEML